MICGTICHVHPVKCKSNTLYSTIKEGIIKGDIFYIFAYTGWFFLTVPPDFQYQNVYVEENPSSSFDRTLTVNYRLITCQPSPSNHNNYDIITIMIISTTNEL